MPVENQTSSQQPGLSAMIFNVRDHAASLAVSGARNLSCITGKLELDMATYDSHLGLEVGVDEDDVRDLAGGDFASVRDAE